MTSASKDLTDAYRSLNASFKRVLVWHVGVDAGFFAEYTAMLHAMLYCLENKLQFRLYSDDANFGTDRGWTDYFEPFCCEEHQKFHHKYNLHGVAAPWREIWRQQGAERRRKAQWKIKLAYRHFVGNLLSLLCYRRRVRLSHTVYLDLWHHFSIPELGIDGDYFHAFSKMVDITWHLNAETAAKAAELERELQMSEHVAGCQIRGGDKITETTLLPPDAYVDIIRREDSSNNVFVLTDDYSLFERVKNLAPERQWYTLCQPSETGYVNAGFTG